MTIDPNSSRIRKYRIVSTVVHKQAKFMLIKELPAELFKDKFSIKVSHEGVVLDFMEGYPKSLIMPIYKSITENNKLKDDFIRYLKKPYW